ncbi:MAG: hypothetical protein ABEK01_01635 [Candidatus Nanohaloarchaea archaeon]
MGFEAYTPLLDGTIALLCFLRLWTVYRREGAESHRYFAKFFLFYGLFFITIALPAYIGGLRNFGVADAAWTTFSTDSLLLFFIAGQGFFLAALAYFSQVPLHIIRPEWKEKVFRLNLGMIFVILPVNLLFFSMPAEEGFAAISTLSLPMAPVFGLLLLGQMVPGILLFGKMAYDRSGTDRMKMALLSVGLLILTVSGPMHSIVSEPGLFILASGFTITGTLTTFAGVYLNRVME